MAVEGAIVARYASSGHLVYLSDPGFELSAVPFDLSSQRATGERVVVARGGWFDVSPAGTLAYVPQGSVNLAGAGSGDLVWFDREGNQTPIPGGENVTGHPVLSPDGERVAVQTGTNAFDLYVLDLSTGGRSRVSLAGRINNFALWSPDGEELVFNSTRSPSGWYRKRWDAAGEAELLFPRTVGYPQITMSWSPQHDMIAYTEINPETREDIWHIASDANGDAVPLVVGPYRERTPMISPDGTRIAYLSDETGTNEAYIASYPDLGGKTAVSSGGATGPRWSAAGDKLYYMSGDRMMAVSVGPGTDINPSRPEELFRGNFLLDSSFHAAEYDVSRDGRFLIIRAHEAQPGPDSFNIVFNSFEELRRLAPANR